MCRPKNFDARLDGSRGADTLKLASDATLREWKVSPRMNLIGEGGDDRRVIEPQV